MKFKQYFFIRIFNCYFLMLQCAYCHEIRKARKSYYMLSNWKIKCTTIFVISQYDKPYQQHSLINQKRTKGRSYGRIFLVYVHYKSMPEFNICTFSPFITEEEDLGRKENFSHNSGILKSFSVCAPLWRNSRVLVFESRWEVRDFGKISP